MLSARKASLAMAESSTECPVVLHRACVLRLVGRKRRKCACQEAGLPPIF